MQRLLCPTLGERECAKVNILPGNLFQERIACHERTLIIKAKLCYCEATIRTAGLLSFLISETIKQMQSKRPRASLLRPLSF